MAKRASKWQFFRAGGVDQVVLVTGDDIGRLGELDQKLWVALACPTKGTEIDDKTVACIDGDKDGRVRAPEVIAAIDWCSKVWKSLDLLVEEGDSVPLSAFDASKPEGKAVLASAKRILRDQDKKEQKEIGLEDVLAMEKAFVATRFNGDGIVPAESAEDDETKQAITDIITALGSVVDRSGKPGVNHKLVNDFFKDAEALITWDAEGEAEGVKPLGDATDAAARALAAVESKVNDYFARCRLAAFDARAVGALGVGEVELQALAVKELSVADADIAKLPLARIDPAGLLPLGPGLNPAWAERMAAFRDAAVVPLEGERATLDAATFARIVAKLAAQRAWRVKEPAGPVFALGLARLEELVAVDAKGTILALIDKDLALEAEYAQIAAVEKAVRLRRDLFRLLRNFVSFADFYGHKGASFQAGTLYLDARACELTVYVNDAAKHAALAGLSKAYLAYCECTRGTEKTHIVAAFTAGDVDALMVGRNGVFYDRKGRDWDATIHSIVENPISVRQAFWSPYKRLVRMIEEQVAKRAVEKEKESMGKVDAAAQAAVSAADRPAGAPVPPPAPGAPPAPPAAPAAPAVAGTEAPKKIDVGTVAAIGVAVAGFATFLSGVIATFLGLGMWLPLGLVALLLAISGPSMLIAYLKLRQRNLGPILDANGWAINARVRLNVPFGSSLTSVAKLPPGAKRAEDPYADKRRPWWLYISLMLVLALSLAWVLGWLDAYFPSWAEKAKSSHVFNRPLTSPSASPSAGASTAPVPDGAASSAAPAPSAPK